MIQKCANPLCGEPFRYFRAGKIYAFDRPVMALPGSSGASGRRAEHYWLCGACSQKLRIVLAEEGSITLIPVAGSTPSYMHVLRSAEIYPQKTNAITFQAANYLPSRSPNLVGGGNMTQKTILVVEDNENLRALVIESLTLANYEVLLAADGLEALQIASQHGGPIHLLITDLVMPGMGGVELAEQLTAVHPETRVLYTSGYLSDVLAPHGGLAPHEAFIEKPFQLSDLRREVARMLASGDKCIAMPAPPSDSATPASRKKGVSSR
jgi:CheY-like chemotaxis protein